mmetsp:Transcript_93371/g.145696  ORF Transcript_93371/g.145696 Transcript_93371/m.145696 type:complete len:120 (+) Transcript_93371:1397-1756(+)
MNQTSMAKIPAHNNFRIIHAENICGRRFKILQAAEIVRHVKSMCFRKQKVQRAIRAAPNNGVMIAVAPPFLNKYATTHRPTIPVPIVEYTTVKGKFFRAKNQPVPTTSIPGTVTRGISK